MTSMMLTKQKRKQNKSPMIRQIEKHLNRRTEYETRREAKHQRIQSTPKWLIDMQKRNQNRASKPPFDWEAYEQERLTKHGVKQSSNA